MSSRYLFLLTLLFLLTGCTTPGWVDFVNHAGFGGVNDWVGYEKPGSHWEKPEHLEQFLRDARIGKRHPYFGVITQKKLELLGDKGVPNAIGLNKYVDEVSGRDLEEWVYLGPDGSQGAVVNYFHDDGTLRDYKVYGRDELNEVLAKLGRLQAGMSKEQVQEAWGEPNSTTRSDSHGGTAAPRLEQWMWNGEDGLPAKIAYFENDTLTRWRE